ncbi:glycosyltransferase family 4 protein [Chryseobacterium sp. RG1]|uniref:Glycosyltransferase family 4 protein n=1 Tax=Chryseobacterium tagetis TaxID=2801334 RepID=A0ABS8A568_9FLAO|nr:glycosyltransferase family 1 protein [Chryseobacterium tagetis]MCA6069134.1 glycosyltransferase family 4 protein [Chryseobacterium tagetis]
MKKIFVNARFLTQRITGVQRFAIEISKILKRELNDDIVFVAPKDIIHKEIAAELNVKIVGHNKSHIWEQIDLRRFLIKNSSPILLNLCNTGPLFYRNNIITIHDIAFEIYPQTYSKKFLITYKYLIPKLAYSAKQIITVSEFSKSEIIKYYNISDNKIHVIYNAVSPEFQQIRNADLEKEKYFLTVSSLNYRKNLNLVLKAFDDLSKTEKDIYLYVVGDLDNRSFSNYDLQKYNLNNRIVFLGRIEDEKLMEYYTSSLAFIYPSLYEGFGIPPLEAQKCEAPVIVSDIPCFHEIFEDSVSYINPHDPIQLTYIMNLHLNYMNRFQQIEKGLDNEKKYDWGKSAKKVLKLLEECER